MVEGEARQGAVSNEWRSHGTLLAPAMAGIALVAVQGYSLGVMMGPLQAEFGWSRAAISTGTMLVSFVSVLLCLPVGRAIDRLGPRPVALVGVLAYTVLLGSFATVSSDIWSWWSHCIALGFASALILPPVWTAAINSVFVVNRGKALAVALLGTGLAATLVPALTSALVDAVGWRSTFVGLAAMAGGTVFVLVVLFFRSAADLRYADRHRAADKAELPGFTVREGFRSASFRRLAAAVTLFGVACLALTINAVPVLESRGLDRSTAAVVAGLLGLGSIIGRIAGGFLLDRFDAKRIAAACVLAPILSIGLLLALPATGANSAAAMFLLGLALGSEVDACAYLAARHFGMRSFGTLFGTINGLVMFGTGLAPVVANRIYDVAGSYDPVLWATGALCALSAALFLGLGPYPNFPSPGSEASEEASGGGVPGTATRGANLEERLELRGLR